MEFSVSADHKVKRKGKDRDRYLDRARELKTMEHESDGDTNCNWRTRYSHQRIDTGTGGLGNKRTSRNCPINNIVKIGHNNKNFRLSIRIQ